MFKNKILDTICDSITDKTSKLNAVLIFTLLDQYAEGEEVPSKDFKELFEIFDLIGNVKESE